MRFIPSIRLQSILSTSFTRSLQRTYIPPPPRRPFATSFTPLNLDTRLNMSDSESDNFVLDDSDSDDYVKPTKSTAAAKKAAPAKKAAAGSSKPAKVR